MESAEVLTRVQQEGVRPVHLLYCDNANVVRGKAAHATRRSLGEALAWPLAEQQRWAERRILHDNTVALHSLRKGATCYALHGVPARAGRSTQHPYRNSSICHLVAQEQPNLIAASDLQSRSYLLIIS